MNIAVRLKQFGNAEKSLEIVDVPAHEPASGEVLLEMLAAPINPADVNIIEGRYGTLPTLPAIIGNEGVGRIVRMGSEVKGLSAGQLVLPMNFGTWTQRMTVSAEDIIALPEGLDIWQAAMLTINPATAWCMLHNFHALKPGDWIVQNAANSAVGRCVIQLAHASGWKTLNVVRREELKEELLAIGADVVVTEETDLRKEAKSLCGNVEPKLGFNAVGGASALNVANALASGSPLVTYGAMSKQPLKIPNGLLIFHGLEFHGFWLSRWRKTVTAAARQSLYTRLAHYLADKTLRVPIHRIFPMIAIHEAIAEASQEKRAGKVLLHFDNLSSNEMERTND